MNEQRGKLLAKARGLGWTIAAAPGGRDLLLIQAPNLSAASIDADPEHLSRDVSRYASLFDPRAYAERNKASRSDLSADQIRSDAEWLMDKVRELADGMAAIADAATPADQDGGEGAYAYGSYDPEAEEVLTLTCGNVRAAWTNLEEGYGGDYDPDDPDDENLLRFDLYRKADGEWEAVEDASCCTRMPASADEALLKTSLRYVLDNLRAALSGESGRSVRHTGAALSWIGPDYDFSQPLPDFQGV